MKNMQKHLHAKCLNGTRTRALTADGFIVPCCWVDSYKCRNHSVYKHFFDEKLHIDNYENVEEIEDSQIWNVVEDMINEAHEDLDLCHKMCSKPEKDTPWRDKISVVEAQ